ncbi:hypothetical protein HDU78_002718 [Chytriomyces hyalinus]|nr:hypothetical protein HDU78_002718 [Chytriomyces hyalinus]
MTSFVFPIAQWTNAAPRLGRVSMVVASSSGTGLLVAAHEGGCIATYQHRHSDERPVLVPRLLLLARSNATITAIALCRMDIDGSSANDNVIVSATHDGEVVLWDIADGRSLLAAQVYPGAITSIAISSSARFIICAGHSNSIVILHASSLAVAKVIQNVESWTSSIALLSTGPQTPDQLFRGCVQGRVTTYLFDEPNLDLVLVGTVEGIDVDTKPSLSLGSGSILDIHVCRFGSNLIMAVKKKVCHILQRGQGAVKSICAIYCTETNLNGGWKGGQFLSSQTVILWTQSGMAWVYFVGHAALVNSETLANIKTNGVGGGIVLLSDGVSVTSLSSGNTTLTNQGVGISDLSYGASAFSAIASFQTDRRFLGSTLCILPTYPSSSSGEGTAKSPHVMYLARFHDSGRRLSCWPFWTNLSLSDAVTIPNGYPAYAQSAKKDASDNIAEGMIKFRYNLDIDLEESKAADFNSGLQITSAALVSDKLIAIGCDSGKIYIAPITDVLFYSAAEFEHHAAWILEGHAGAVKCLFQLESPSTGTSKNILVSGGVDLTIKIWNLELGSLMASLVCHSHCVKTFLPIPQNSGMRVKHGVISIAEDQSIAIIDLDSLQSVHILSGHMHPISALHWRSHEETIVVQCCNSEGTIYVWQLKTGHLDRIEELETAEDIISCCDKTVTLSDFSQDYGSASGKQTFSAYPIFSGVETTPILFILQINLKRFINDIYGGQYSITPPGTPPQSRSQARPNSHRLNHRRTVSSLSTNAASPEVDAPESPTRSSHVGLQVPSVFNKSPSLGSNRIRLGSSTSAASFVGGSPLPTRPTSSVEKPSGGTQMNADHHQISAQIEDVRPVTRGPADRNLVRGVLSATMVWGLDASVDQTCHDVLEMGVPSSLVSVGNRGANGYISVPFPSSVSAVSDWTLSPTMSASRMLQVTALLRTFGSKKEYEKQISELISTLCNIAPAKSSDSAAKYQYPSFAFLCKYWQDQIMDVQQAARKLFVSTLKNMSEDDKRAVIDYWKSLLPASQKQNSKTNMRAAILLGIIGCEEPSLYSIRLCKDVAETLDALLKEDVRGPYRMLAVELLGRGFKTWEPHVNASNVLRSIISTTGLQSPSTPSGAPSPSSKDGHGGSQPLGNALVMVSRQAVVQIASINPGLFISTVTFDFVHSKIAAERVGGLKLLGMFIAKKPLLLYSHVPRIIEAMVKSLDPNVPGMREAVQTVVTSNFAELVKTFPNVSFHHGSQKLAVGTMEGVTIVYDLKTATKGYVFEGHTKPVTAVAFSPDGKLCVSFSLEENCVRFWQLSTGFLNSFANAFGGASPASGGTAGHVKSFREFMAGAPQKPNPATNFDVKFEWLTERSVKLHSIDEIQLVFTV